jgi:hypothetical protein
MNRNTRSSRRRSASARRQLLLLLARGDSTWCHLEGLPIASCRRLRFPDTVTTHASKRGDHDDRASNAVRASSALRLWLLRGLPGLAGTLRLASPRHRRPRPLRRIDASRVRASARAVPQRHLVTHVLKKKAFIMNTVLEIRTDLDSSDRISINTSARDLRLADRIALRIGLALLLWGDRRHRVDPAVAHRRQLERLRAERERDAMVAATGLFRRP